MHNHSRRKDVTHSEIVLPGHLADQNMEWARNRASLWNAVESAESRKNARVATEIQVTLPSELPPERRLEIARTFSREVADNYNVAVDLAVHDPRPSGDPRNFHAHLMLTTREVTPEGLGAKTGLNLQASDRLRLGLPNVSQEFTAIRERWATITNEALKAAQIEARVDHRSLAEQGIDREPRPHIPFAAFKIERAGKHSEVAESIRADYAARVQARAKHAVQKAAEASVATTPSVRKTMEDIRREARENWLRMRAAQNAIAPPTAPALASASTIAASASAAPASPSAAPNSPTASQAREDDHHP